MCVKSPKLTASGLSTFWRSRGVFLKRSLRGSPRGQSPLGEKAVRAGLRPARTALAAPLTGGGSLCYNETSYRGATPKAF